MTSPSIVDLFKNSNPRSKLFIQLIPPGFGEDEFKELIKEYLNEIDYMVFRPGKIIRDQYGHLICLECPNYGFATINFKNPRTCPKFHREFHQFQLSDGFNIKSKLFIEFALMQKVPETLDVFESKEENFRDLAIFKEFLKTFPFAAKTEEDRLTEIGPVSIDLEDETGSDLQQQQIPATKISELDAKLSILIAPTSPFPQVSFSSLLAKNSGLKSSTEVVTPLTEFIKTLSLNQQLPPANKKKEKKEKEKRERKRKEKKKKEEPVKADKSVKSGKTNKSDKNKTTSSNPQSEKKSFSTNKTNTTSMAESLAENKQAPQFKGAPKILTRNPIREAIPVAVAVVEAEIYKPPVPSARQPYIPSSTKPISETINSGAYAEYVMKTLPPISNGNERISEVAYSPRGLYVPPSSSIDSQVQSFNNNEHTKPIRKRKSAKKDDNSLGNSPRAPYVPPPLIKPETRVPDVQTYVDTQLKPSTNYEIAKLTPKSNSSNNSTKKEGDIYFHDAAVDYLAKILTGEEAAYAPKASHVMSELINADPFVPSTTITTTIAAKRNSNIKTANQPKKQPKGKTLVERSAKPSSSREPDIIPDLTSVPAEPVAAVNPPQFKHPKQKPVKEPVTETGPKKVVIKTAQSQPNSPKNQSSETAVNPAPIKKVFTSSAKMRESTQIQ